MKDLPAIKELIALSKNIVITMHASPDADALGSSLGLYHFLKSEGHAVQVVAPTDYPNFLNWMPSHQGVIVFSEKTTTQVSSCFEKADLIFCLDFSGLSRVGKMQSILRDATAKKIIVDHHLNPEDFAQLMVRDTKAAATAELIYEMIVEMNGRSAVDKTIASCLYAGIMTDTGSFRHSNTTPKVHRIVAELMESGAESARISHAIYDTYSLNRLRFLGFALNELLVVNEEMNVAHFAIPMDVFDTYKLKKGDTEGLVNYALSIDGIVAAALFKEAEGEIKISFRSFGEIGVNKFAEKYFDGGGHKNAAGGHTYESLDNTVSKFEKLINKNALLTK